MSRDFSRPQSPRRVTELLRHLTENVEREAELRQRLGTAAGSLLDVPTDGPEGLAPLLSALVGASASFDSACVLARGDAGAAVLAAIGLPASGATLELGEEGSGFAAEALRSRGLLIASADDVGAPFPPGTRAAAAVPMLSGSEIAGAVLAGSRSAPDVAQSDVLLLRIVAERAGRAVERRELRDALARSEAFARRTSAFRDQILGIVGHDLRNPLGAISMSAALLSKRAGLGGWQAKTVARIRSSTARMERIINDLLSYTRTRLGTGIPIERTGTDLRELARKVVDEIVAFHPDCPVHIEADGDLAGEWDPARIEQLLSNIVANAVDHGDPDCRVEVRIAGAGDEVRLEVVNRGEMPPAAAAHAFEPFQRRPEHEARKASGLGLGLYIAREIVRGHGGDIAVRSGDGETRVSVRLPRRGGDSDQPSA